MRIALSERRLSQWEDLLDELTHHQLQVLEAYYHIEPWGEDRADLREATMATAISSIFSMGDTPTEVFVERVKQLAGYMGDGNDKPQFVSPNAAAAAMRQVIKAENK